MASEVEHETHRAARAGQRDAVADLLDRGAPVDSKNEAGITALASAAMRGHLGVVRLLLESGADPNAVSPDGSTVLMSTAEFPRPQVVDLLIDYGARVNEVGPGGRTALLSAVWSTDSSPQVIAALLRAGADPEITDEMLGRTPREWAQDGLADIVAVFDSFIPGSDS